MFTDSDVISSYSRLDAIEDGILIDVTNLARTVGYTFPVAVTTNLFVSHIKHADPDITAYRLKQVLETVLKAHKTDKEDTLLYTQIHNANDHIDVWAAIEGRSRIDPRPAMNIMLPSDY